MRNLCTPALLLLLPLALSAQQSSAPPAPNPAALQAQPTSNNTSLTGAIMERLITDPVLENTTITVAVANNGAVTLNGAVAQQALADRAADVVKSVPGVKSTKNMILVSNDPFAPPKPPLPSPLPPINAALPAPPASNSPQTRLSDALARSAGLVRVASSIYDNEVLLFGTVETEQAKKQATEIARAVLPKAPVQNIIWVNPHPLSPPPMIPQ
ncbi:MAG: BON domain-containing protein [Acidobacteria bacterium]|nr:MAG: BON domain-containing protein [Acidobacteriota bacterium]